VAQAVQAARAARAALALLEDFWICLCLAAAEVCPEAQGAAVEPVALAAALLVALEAAAAAVAAAAVEAAEDSSTTAWEVAGVAVIALVLVTFWAWMALVKVQVAAVAAVAEAWVDLVAALVDLEATQALADLEQVVVARWAPTSAAAHPTTSLVAALGVATLGLACSRGLGKEEAATAWEQVTLTCTADRCRPRTVWQDWAALVRWVATWAAAV